MFAPWRRVLPSSYFLASSSRHRALATLPRRALSSSASDTSVAGSGDAAEASSSSAAAAKAPRLPFFLLDKVLYPHAKMNLTVFEPRYRLMVDDALKTEAKTFGLLSTSTAPPDTKRKIALETDWRGSNVGTLAKIVHWERIKGDRLQIEVQGTQRFKVLDHDRNLFGFWEGGVELLDAEASTSTLSAVAEPVDTNPASLVSDSSSVSAPAHTEPASTQPVVPQEPVFVAPATPEALEPTATPSAHDEMMSLAKQSLEVLQRCIDKRGELDTEDNWPLLMNDLVKELQELLATGGLDQFSYKLGSIMPIPLAQHQRILSASTLLERLTHQLAALNEFWTAKHASKSDSVANNTSNSAAAAKDKKPNPSA